MWRSCLLLVAYASSSVVVAGDDPPLELGLRERSSAELTQVQLVLNGRESDLVGLVAADFQVLLGSQETREFKLDRLGRTSAVDGSRTTTPASYMLYFDQPHLTFAGRKRALSLAQSIVPLLADGTSEIAVMSSGRELRTVQGFTDEQHRIQAALAEVERDRDDWSFSAEQEEQRVAQIRREAMDDEIAQAKGLAYQYARDEADLARVSIKRFVNALSVFSGREQPRVVLFFADTLRREPGQHYLELLGMLNQAMLFERNPAERGCSDHVKGNPNYKVPKLDPLRFEDIMAAANAAGVRVYAILGLGLIESSASANAAERALRQMASETGGRAFVRGEPARKIAQQVLTDVRSTWLLSLPADALERDRRLALTVKARVPNVKVAAPAYLIVESSAERVTRHILSGFVGPEGPQVTSAIEAGIVPLAYQDGKYLGLLQVKVAATKGAGAEWDLGATLMSEGRVRAESSGRVALQGGVAPVVLEDAVEFQPGRYRLVAVAREEIEDSMLSLSDESTWPNPAESFVAVASPVMILQPESAVFSRDGVIRRDGSLLRNESLSSGKYTAFISLVCRGRTKSDLTVERVLAGETEHRFEPIHLPPDQQCTQLRDVIPAEYLGSGMFKYRIDVAEGNGSRVNLAERDMSTK